MKENHYLVPKQTHGEEKDIEHKIDAPTAEDAEDWFVDAKEKLLDVNNWKKYSSSGLINFVLTDSKGKVARRNAHRGDHIRIESPAISPEQGTGLDWVIIEALEYDDYPDIDMEAFAMRVRPSADPVLEQLPAEWNNATSTFVIDRRGKHLHANYHGRNELALVNINVGPNGEESMETEPWLGLSDELLRAMIMGFLA